MCTREEVQEIVNKSATINNELRNENLKRQLEKLKMEIFEKMNGHFDRKMEHIKTSPETQKELNKIHITCATRGRDIANMDDKIDNLCEQVQTTNDKLDKLMEKLDGKYAAKITEHIVYALIGILTLGALYLIFDVAKLPH